TAIMLSNSIIVDNPITVEPYSQSTRPPPTNGVSSEVKSLTHEPSQYSKYLASGYLTAENLDAKLGVSKVALGAFDIAKSVDTKYGISSFGWRVAQYWKVPERVDHLMETSAGRVIKNRIDTIKTNVLQVVEEAQTLVEENRIQQKTNSDNGHALTS
ncbi:hypothetical protein HK102_008859, partial [Quaeritorhiza haematococci]